MTYAITLASVGNPDFGENPDRPLSPTRTVMVDSLEQASATARAYIDRHRLGGGNFVTAPVMRGNRLVAHVSYNGRIWPVAGDA